MRVLTGDSLNLLSSQFDEGIILFTVSLLLQSSASVASSTNRWTELPWTHHSSRISNFFMEDFYVALNWVAFKPTCCCHYVDDTFVIWPHGPEWQNDFLNHLNKTHSNSQFTMETDE